MVFQNSIPAITKYNSKRKSYYAKRKFAKRSPKSSLFYLRKQVGYIKRKMRGDRVILHTTSNVDFNKDIVSPCAQLRLTRFIDHIGCLGTDNEDLLDDKVKLLKLSSHINISLENVNNEEETTNFSVFLVSLKDNGGSMIDPANGFLAMTSGSDYYQYSGWTFLNKDKFTIHHYKHFQLTNYGSALSASAAQNKYGTNIDFDWKTPVNSIIKPNAPGAGATAGSWKSNGYQADPSQNYYLLIFNDNSSVDTEYPLVKHLTICTFEKMD